MNRIRHSLASKLSLRILLLTAPLFIVGLGILFIQSRQILRKESEQRATSALNTSMERLNRYLRTVETAVNANEWLVLENLQPDSLLTYSRQITMLNGNTDGCSITTEPGLFPEYGRYFSAYSVLQGDTIVTVREKPYEYFEKVWYKTPKMLGKACWVEPFDDYNEGTLSASDYIASYCKPLFTPDSQMIGVITADIKLHRLADAIDDEQPYPHSYYIMIGEKGNFFVHPDSTMLYEKTIFSGKDPKKNADIFALGYQMRAGHEGSMQVRIDGQDCLVCYKPVEGTSWSLALVCPLNDILKNYRRLAYILVSLVVIGLIVIILVCRQNVNMAVSPIRQLLRQAQRIGEGHYDEQIAHTSRDDAVGRLQNSFATMQESLNHHVNDIHHANEETEQRNQQLAEATRMAEEAAHQKTLFIQNMTHQIRTPLNIIIGFAQVLRDSCGSGASQEERLPEEEIKGITDMMQRNTVSLHRMLLMLYDSSETGMAQEQASLKNDVLGCNQLARECIEENNRRFPGVNFAFRTEVPDDLTIRTNKVYLSRTILELLYNAVKYSDKQHITLCVGTTDEGVSFTVEDTGPGMDPDYLGQMYEPFTKVNDLSEGLGLGLPLCQNHASNLGGDITLDPDYHEGCRFIVKLPRL